MKKIFIFVIVAVMIISFCGCSDNSGKNDNTKPSDSVAGETNKNAKASEGELKVLVDANLYVFNNIIDMKYLPHEEKAKDGLYKVIESQFSSVADIREYLLNVYTADTASEIMRKVNELYKDIDGQLYIDETKMTARGYNVDWSDYTIETVKDNGITCNFKVTARTVEPGENVEPTPYEKEVTAVRLEDGWRLSKSFR